MARTAAVQKNAEPSAAKYPYRPASDNQYIPPDVDVLPVALMSSTNRRRILLNEICSGDAHFNSSLVIWSGKRLLAYRFGLFESTIRIAELDESLTPTNCWEIDIPRSRRNKLAVEDPRFFIRGGELWLAVIGLAFDPIAKYSSDVQLVRLDSESLQPVESYFPKYEPRREWEKNWGMFEYGGK